MEAPRGKQSKLPVTLMLIGWLLATVALAGPVWHKLPEPVHQRQNALVVIMDLTRSMYAVDMQPNRLIRERRKLTDLLNERKEGTTALVVFAGDAHVVTPLTDDPNNIKVMIPALRPEIMPVPGSRLTPALKLAYQLFRNGGADDGRILVMTDQIRDMASAMALAHAHRNQYPVSVIAVGTAQGAPISAARLTPNGGYLRDRNGNLIIPKVNFGALQRFAQAAGGRFSRITLNDSDLRYVLPDTPLPGRAKYKTLQRDFDVWREEGPWLLLLLLPIAAFAFRRGWLWSLVPLLFVMHSGQAQASLWQDLWKTPYQQGSAALKRGDAKQAAQLFKNPAWRATAQYRSKDYAAAAKAFARMDTSNGKYNLGNALAHQGHYKAAIGAYDKALAMNPKNADAAYNKKLLEKLLKQRQQREQQQKKQGHKKGKQQHGKGSNGANRQQQHNGKSGQKPGEQSQQQQRQGHGQRQHEASGANRQQQGQQKKNRAQSQAEQQAARRRAAERKREQQAQARQAARGQKGKHGKRHHMTGDNNHLTNEQRQAIRQWLRRVPDDPGGLLKRKFALQHEQEIQEGKIKPDDTQNY